MSKISSSYLENFMFCTRKTIDYLKSDYLYGENDKAMVHMLRTLSLQFELAALTEGTSVTTLEKLLQLEQGFRVIPEGQEQQELKDFYRVIGEVKDVFSNTILAMKKTDGV